MSGEESNSLEFGFPYYDYPYRGKLPIKIPSYLGGQCLVRAMVLANKGNEDVAKEIRDTSKKTGPLPSDLAIRCGVCSITLVKNNGLVYGSSPCSEVQEGVLNRYEE